MTEDQKDRYVKIISIHLAEKNNDPLYYKYMFWKRACNFTKRLLSLINKRRLL